MNELDQVTWAVLFFFFPALMGFFLHKQFKVKPSVILMMSIILFAFGYFTYVVFCLSSLCMLIGLLFSLYVKDKEEK